jgi:hypothetical protein
MNDRAVRVRLEATVTQFVADVGGAAVKAVDRLGDASDTADRKIKKLGHSAVGAAVNAQMRVAAAGVEKLGAAADKTSDKLKKLEAAAVRAGRRQEDALGALRLAEQRLAEVRKKNGDDSNAVARAEEALAKARRRAADAAENLFSANEAVTKRKAEEAGGRSGKAFTDSLKRWLTGKGADAGKEGGTVFGSGFLGALKTPILGPAIVAILTAVVLTALPAVGAVAAGAFVTGFGGGLAGLGLVFAAKSKEVGQVWSTTMTQLGADMQLISKPFESTLINIAGYFKRTVDTFNPVLAKAFEPLSRSVDSFVNNFAASLDQLAPAVAPISQAFTKVLDDLGQGGAIKSMIGDISDGLINLAHSVEANPQAIGDFVRGLGDIVKTALNLITTLNDVNTKFEDLTGGISLVDVTMQGLKATLAPLQGLFIATGAGLDVLNSLTHSTDASGASMASAAAKTVGLAQGLGKTGDSAQHAKTGTDAAAAALERAQKRAQDARDAFERFISTTFRLQNQLLTLSGAQISFQAAIDAASASIKENGKNLDITTEKGRANKSALDDVAKAANDQTEQMIRTGKGTVAAAESASASRASFVRLATQMGLSKAQAQALAAQLIAIPNVSREARLKANITDLESKLATAKAKLKDPKLTATQRAKLEANIKNLEAGIANAKAALNSVPASKTVAITVNTYRNMVETTTHRDVGVRVPPPKVNADGGYYPGGVIPSYANGKLPTQAMVAPGRGRGMVQWAEAETGGEAFIPLAPSKRERSTKILGTVASQFGYGLVRSFASGGLLPGGDLVDINYLLQQLGIPFNPLAGINYSATLTAANRANRAAVPYKNAALKADRAEQAAKAEVARIQRAITLQQRAIKAARAPKQTTKAGQAAEDKRVAEEQKKLIALQDQLYKAKNKSTAATKASNAADAAYKVKLDAATKANEAHKASIEALIEQQKAAVEMAKQVAAGLMQGANIGDLFQKSLTGKGLLSDLQQQGADLAKFGDLVSKLRKAGLDEDLIQQIVGKGAAGGTDVAQAILTGGLALINSLNRAQWNLEKQANTIGAGSAAAQYGVNAVTGKRALGGSVAARATYVVGENGPEILRMGADSGWVHPNRMYASASSGGTTHVTEVHQHFTFTDASRSEVELVASRAKAKLEFAARS